MKLGIIIPTYQKPDGLTPFLLKRAIESIKKQTYRDYLLIIIGDKYENNSEFEAICNDKELEGKIIYKNLPIAKEREKYPAGSKELWSAGGVNACNYGINLGLESGLTYICHLDHDDYWHPQHLELIVHTIKTTNNPAFIYSCGTYFNSYLPYVPLTNEIIISNPQPGKTIHSSTCINVNKIPLLYRDVYQETGMIEPADADMWTRVSKYIIDNELTSFLITSITCYHLTENQ
jgi:glycosyltransferase involved in cell wall biosynthesis